MTPTTTWTQVLLVITLAVTNAESQTTCVTDLIANCNPSSCCQDDPAVQSMVKSNCATTCCEITCAPTAAPTLSPSTAAPTVPPSMPPTYFPTLSPIALSSCVDDLIATCVIDNCCSEDLSARSTILAVCASTCCDVICNPIDTSQPKITTQEGKITMTAMDVNFVTASGNINLNKLDDQVNVQEAAMTNVRDTLTEYISRFDFNLSTLDTSTDTKIEALQSLLQSSVKRLDEKTDSNLETLGGSVKGIYSRVDTVTASLKTTNQNLAKATTNIAKTNTDVVSLKKVDSSVVARLDALNKSLIELSTRVEYSNCAQAYTAGQKTTGLVRLKSGMAYCDMETTGGGWTLIASVHEDNVRAKCNSKDVWTNSKGNGKSSRGNSGNVGDGHWQDEKSTFGSAPNACKDDFKNELYGTLKAKNVMLWHVPNGKEAKDWDKTAIWKYHTSNNFLNSYGGLFPKIFQKHKLQSQTKSCRQTGPAVPVKFVKGTEGDLFGNIAPNSQGESTRGFIHFSVVNNERAMNAMCAGIRYNGCNTEHACLGGAGYFPEGNPRQCSDFSGWDWDGYGTLNSWSASKKMTEAAVLIFVK